MPIDDLTSNLHSKLSSARDQLEHTEANIKSVSDAARADLGEKIKAAKAGFAKKREGLRQKKMDLFAKLETYQDVREAEHAQDRARDSVAYAEACVDFAVVAIQEAEIAMLQAVHAQVEAEDIAEQQRGA